MAWSNVLLLINEYLAESLLLGVAFGLIFFSVFVLLRWLLFSRRRSSAWVDCQFQLEEYRQELEKANWQTEQLQLQLNTALVEVKSLQNRDVSQRERIVELQVRSEEQQKAAEAEISRLLSLKGVLVDEFEKQLGQLLQRQQRYFEESSSQKMDSVLTPLQRQLKEFRERVDEVHSNEVAHTNQLLGQIHQLQSQSQKIGSDAVRLTNALKGDNKLLGNWGEWVLQRLLEEFGLREGKDFQLQQSTKNDAGKRMQPDVVIHLPNQRHIVVDSKVSLLAYEQIFSNESPENKSLHEKALAVSFKQHIRSLGKKRYDQLPGMESPDFVVMFVPVEPAFYCALKLYPELLRDAYSQGVVVACPSSFMAILNIIDSLWQKQKQDKNVELIMQEAGKLYDQFARFVDSMGELGAGLERVRKAYDLSVLRLQGGKGNVLKRMQYIRELGVKTQKDVTELETFTE